MTAYQMIKPAALAEFKRQVAAGHLPTKLPEGAFDQMPSELAPQARGLLSPDVTRQLDALNADTQRAVHQHLSKALSRRRLSGDAVAPIHKSFDQDDPDNNNMSLAQKICGFLDGKVDSSILTEIERMCEGSGADNVAPIKKSYDQVSGGLADAYDPVQGTAMDEPLPFSGRPRPGGRMDAMTSASRGGSDAERQMALRNSSRVRVDSPGGDAQQFYRNGTLDQHAYANRDRPPAMDSAASLKGFLWRYPGAARIKLA
jgi:hypothetical protein